MLKTDTTTAMQSTISIALLFLGLLKACSVGRLDARRRYRTAGTNNQSANNMILEVAGDRGKTEKIRDCPRRLCRPQGQEENAAGESVGPASRNTRSRLGQETCRRQHPAGLSCVLLL